MDDRFAGWDLDAHRRFLRAYAQRLHTDGKVKVRFDESDLVQETMTKAYTTRAFPQGMTEPAQQRGWLLSIMRTVLIDMDRHEKTQKNDVYREADARAVSAAMSDSAADMGAHIADDAPTPDQEAERRELVARAEARMTPDELAVFRDKAQGYKLQEIADRTGWSVTKVHQLYQRAVEKSRE